MRVHRSIRFAALASILGLMPASNSQSMPQPVADSLAIGKQDLAQERWQDAEQFFYAYLQQSPDSSDAQLDLGFAYFAERRYDKSEQSFLKLIAVNPKNWAAHNDLVEVYAGQERWADFNRERELIKLARDRGELGENKPVTAVIDVLYVGDEKYIVRDYDPPSGRFHALYNFTHFDKLKQLDFWISCESDDIDQIEFAKQHPKEAAAGQRSFSLDSYTPVTKTPSGQMTQTHGTIKFYPDGEPAYQTVRTDVLKVFARSPGPMKLPNTLQLPAPGPTPKP
jgi:tetratricopeptide (TPR) repeat protein